MENKFDLIIGIATVLGTVATWIALYPIFQPKLFKFLGKIQEVSSEESSYLKSLILDLEQKNLRNRWSDKFYVDVDTELQERIPSYDVPPAFYVIKSINRGVKEQDFNNLSNVEKIDSSRGRTFNSLAGALGEAQDNAVIVIAAPGNGKTVSLRNLTIKRAETRLSERINKVPIFINLGYYIGLNADGSIQDFEVFLEEYLSKSGYLRYLANRNWERLLKEGRCIFFLDGIDELPRKSGEYEERSRKIANFVKSWPNIQFILSCRELDYNRELAFQQILIKPFDRKHIRTYLRKYFSKITFRKIFPLLEASGGIFELVTNPFYLDLVCYFSKFMQKIPENKSQLFNFIVDQFIERECSKQGIDLTNKFKDTFINVMSDLAYFMAVKKMVTTTGIKNYIHSVKQHQEYYPILQFAIKGNLLDFNPQTEEIRFIHNRFQEFFSSFYILANYKKDKSILPQNVFTNVWWKETVLFVAGLEEDVDSLIHMINKRRDLVSPSNLVDNLTRIEMSSLALECMWGNLSFNNKELYKKVRGELFSEYNKGNTLVKAKILFAFRHDKSFEVQQLLVEALDDESLWVSERAFFMLSDEQLRIPMSPKGVLREYWRFFIEGRLLNTVIPVIKGATKSNLIRIFMPLYVLLLILSFASVIFVFYIFYTFVEFLIHKFEFALTAECIKCLLTMAIAIYTIVYAFIKNNYPILKRFIYIIPLALLVRFLVFNIPASFISKIPMLALGYLFYYLYTRFIKRPNEDDLSLGTITAFVFGYSLLIPVFNYDAVLKDMEANPIVPQVAQVAPIIRETIESSPTLKRIIEPITELGKTINPPSTQPVESNNNKPYVYGLIGGLVVVLLIFMRYIWSQVRSFSSLSACKEKADIWLNMSISEAEKVNEIHELLVKLPSNWSQKLFIRYILDKMSLELNLSREYKMQFLGLLALKTQAINLRDSIYQYLEEEHNNYRRSV